MRLSRIKGQRDSGDDEKKVASPEARHFEQGGVCVPIDMAYLSLTRAYGLALCPLLFNLLEVILLLLFDLFGCQLVLV